MPGATRPTRSWLFTPGTWPNRFAKAAEIGADVLIIDLEDAVAPDNKPGARETALDFASRRKETANAVAIRINGLDTPAGIADVDALLASDAAPDYLVLPKTESAGHLQILDRLLTTAKRPTRLVKLVESNRGLAAVEAIAGATPRLAALMLGAADMAADVGAATAWAPLAYVRSRLVLACALAGVGSIDSPFSMCMTPRAWRARLRTPWRSAFRPRRQSIRARSVRSTTRSRLHRRRSSTPRPYSRQTPRASASWDGQM
jgi:(S)-citramalyl-CoA lyase